MQPVLSPLLALGFVPAQAPTGWRTLFDGKSLDQWDQIGDAN